MGIWQSLARKHLKRKHLSSVIRSGDAMTDASTWIADYLTANADPSGEASAAAVIAAAEADGFTARQIVKARWRARSSIRTRRAGSPPGWRWSLTQPEPQPEEI